MTVNEIYDAIKDHKDLDIWVDNGDQMWAADGTMETAQEMLDAIEEGARVEVRIYYDEDGNRVPSDEYSSDVDVETIFDSDDSIANEYGDGKRFVKIDDDSLERFRQLGVFGVYKAIKNKYGKKYCFFDNWTHQFAYKDDTRTISLSVYRDADGNPSESNYIYFDKKENYQNTATYQVTSWDEVIEHFIDEIKER